MKYPISIVKIKILGTSSYSNTNIHLDNQKTLRIQIPYTDGNQETTEMGRKRKGHFCLCYTQMQKGFPSYNLQPLARMNSQSKVTKQSNKGKGQKTVQSDRPSNYT